MSEPRNAHSVPELPSKHTATNPFDEEQRKVDRNETRWRPPPCWHSDAAFGSHGSCLLKKGSHSMSSIMQTSCLYSLPKKGTGRKDYPTTYVPERAFHNVRSGCPPVPTERTKVLSQNGHFDLGFHFYHHHLRWPPLRSLWFSQWIMESQIYLHWGKIIPAHNRIQYR